MRRFIAFLIISIAFLGATTAQPYKIEYRSENDKKGFPDLKEIIFRDTVANKIIRQIDVEAMNPFSRLSYPEYAAKSEKIGRKVYDLRGKKLNEIIPADILSLYHFDDPSAIFLTQGRYSVEKREFNNDMVILKFSFAVGDDSTMYAQYTDMYVYKADGSEIYSIKNNKYNIIESVIDPSGRYLCYTYGLRKGTIPILDGGIKIIDLKENHPVMDFPGYEITLKFINDHMMYFFYNGQIRDHRPDRWLKVLDFSKMNMYSRCFAFLDMMDIKEITADGLKYKNDSMVSYLPTFTIEKLAWKDYNYDGNFIEYEYYPDVTFESQLKTIVFRSQGGKNIVRTLSIPEFNPFRKLPFAVADSQGHNVKFYALQGASPVTVFPKEVYELYLPLFTKTTELQSGRTSLVSSGDRHHACLVFTFSAGLRFENLAAYSKLFLFNTDGSLMFSREDADGYIWDARLDENADYLCYRYAVGNINTILKTGYKIWDLKKTGYMAEIVTDDAACNFVLPGFLCFYSNTILDDGSAATLLKVVDLKNDMIYSRVYDNHRIQNVGAYTTEGVIFKDNKTDYYKVDFAGEKLSWKKITGKKE